MAAQRQEERVSTAKARGSRDDDSLGCQKISWYMWAWGWEPNALENSSPWKL